MKVIYQFGGKRIIYLYLRHTIPLSVKKTISVYFDYRIFVLFYIYAPNLFPCFPPPPSWRPTLQHQRPQIGLYSRAQPHPLRTFLWTLPNPAEITSPDDFDQLILFTRQTIFKLAPVTTADYRTVPFLLRLVRTTRDLDIASRRLRLARRCLFESARHPLAFIRDFFTATPSIGTSPTSPP